MASPSGVIDLVFPGRTSCAYLRQGEADYLKRLSRFADVTLKPVKAGRSFDGSGASVIKAEGVEMLRKIPASHGVIALDPGGMELSSEEFAVLLGRQREEGRGISFAIGGHLGLAAVIKERADRLMAISRMTFTHEMARMFLLEQIYRGYNIMAGSEYHK